MATEINAGRVAMVPKGEWSASTAYVRLDVVSYHGSSYVCKQDGTGQIPDTATNYWQLLSSGLDPTVDTISAKHYDGSTVTAETSISAAGVISKTASGVTKTYDLPAESGTLARREETLPNKTYAQAEFSGLGRKYLQKNIVSNKNVLTQAMFQDKNGNALENTIFVIQYDYDLNGQSITIPDGCTLLFEGGSLNNGTIVGQNTAIEAPLSKIFGSTLDISGTWFIECLLPEWFGAKPNDAQVDNAIYINKALEVGVAIHAAVMLQAGEYHTATTVNLISTSTARGEVYTPALVGKGRSVSRIVSTASLAVYVEGNHIRLNDIGIFRGGTISGINLTGIGIQFGDNTTQKAAKRSSIKDLMIHGFEKGMLFLYSWCNCTENIVIVRCGNGVELTHTCTEEKLERFIIEECYNCAIYSSYVWSIAITNSVIEGNCYGIKIDSASVVSINNCYFEVNSEYQVYIRGWINTMPETDAQGVVINGGHILLGTSSNANSIVYNANVTGCYFANHDTWTTRPEDDPNNHKLVFDKVKSLTLYSCAKLISGYVVITENCVVSRLDNTSYDSAYHADGVPRQDKAFGFPFAIDARTFGKYIVGSNRTHNILPSVSVTSGWANLVVFYKNAATCFRTRADADDRYMKFSIKDENIIKSLDYNFLVALDYGFGLNTSSNIPDYLASINLTLIKDDDTEVSLFTQTREWSLKVGATRFMRQLDLNSYKNHIKQLDITISISNEDIAEWVSDVDDETNKTFFVKGLYLTKVGELLNSYNGNGGSILFNTSVLDVDRALHLPVTTPSVEKKAGTMVYDTTSSKAKYYNGTKWIEHDGASAGVSRSGTTANRPASADIYVGFTYFDTTLGMDVVWNGSAWVQLQSALTFDSSPTSASANPVTSGGVYTALDGKQEKTAATSTIPTSGGLLPNVLYHFGVTDSPTITLNTTGIDPTIANEWQFTFIAKTSSCSVIMPSDVLLANGFSWDMEAFRCFHVSIKQIPAAKGGDDYNSPAVFMATVDYIDITPDKNYLTIESLGAGNVTITIPAGVDSNYMTSISYSKDRVNWTDTNIDNTEQTITIPVVANDKVFIKGIGSATSSGTQHSRITCNANHNLSGNIMSLLYGDNFMGQSIPLTSQSTFRALFNNTTTLKSAENLALPSQTATISCYYSMFVGCNNLEKAPKLPATTLQNTCYTYMFKGCAKISYIKMLATSMSSTNCLLDWVDGVAATGTFVKAASMTSLPSGASGIPNGWSVEDES